MNFRLKKFPDPVRVISSDKNVIFCIAKSSGIQKNTTFFDEVVWAKIRVKNDGTSKGAPNLVSSHINTWDYIY